MRNTRGTKRNEKNIKMKKDMKQIFVDSIEELFPDNRPFEIGYIEHTLLDVELVCSKTNIISGRPWLTLLVDSYSKKVLAINLSLDPPSHINMHDDYPRVRKKTLQTT